MCDFVAGCDGTHGISRQAIPEEVRRIYEKAYPFAWLGILAETPPVAKKIVYVNSPFGFALFSMRSASLSRNYLQVGVEERLEEWPEARIWEELRRRLGGAASIKPGPLRERILTPLHSLVVEPMQFGRLFLAGDAAHVVPPTGAKGLNLAVCDAVVLARALVAYYRRGDEVGLRQYTETCARHVWQAEHFSWWMTLLLHWLEDPFDHQVQRAQLRYLISHEAPQRYLAENYTGLLTSGLYVEWVPIGEG